MRPAFVTAAPPPPPASSKGVAAIALGGLCPHCEGRTLFAGFARFAPCCARCALDFTQFNVGDGPAAFLIMIVGTLITIGAIVVELRFEPPIWLHLLLWPAITLALVMGLLRTAKAALLALEYRNRAAEGRLAE